MLAKWIERHKRSILFLIALIAVGGAITAVSLPTSLFPDVSFPRIVVLLDAGDRPAEQMVMQVTMPVEEAVKRIPGVNSVNSKSSRGSAEISVNLNWGLDVVRSTLEINAAVSQILPTLPPGTQMQVKRMDPTVFPIIAYSLTSKTVPLSRLYDLAQYSLRPDLASVPGVSRVQVIGGARAEYQVIVDPNRLAALKLTMSDIARVLNSGNVIAADGRLEDHYKLYLVITNSPTTSIEDIRHLVISAGPTGLIHLQDVATVQVGTEPEWTRVTADGTDAVLVNIYQQPGSNSIAIAKDVRAHLDALKLTLPQGVSVANWYDQGVLVTDSAASVRDAILIGVVLASLTLFAFLRNWKVTVIAVAIVPVVIASTVVLLRTFNMGFNIMTLGGMAAAVGLIIDDAIVMIEHIARRLHELNGEGVKDRIVELAMEFTRPLAGSSLATLVIFVPLAFLEGVTGAFFKALSATMASALAISFCVTWLGIPILCSAWLSPKDIGNEKDGRVFKIVRQIYERGSQKLAERPIWILLGIVPLLLVSVIAYRQVGSGFMPTMDEGGFILDYRVPPGTSLTEADRLIRQVEAVIQRNQNVETYSRRSGTGLGGGVSESNQGDFFIRLKSGKRAPIETVMDDVRNQLASEVPGVEVEMAQLMEDLIGDLTAVPQPIQIKLFSNNVDALEATAKRVASAIEKVNGIVEVKNGIVPAGDALEIRVSPERAALEGVDADFVSRAVSDMLAGNVATKIQNGPKMVGVRVWTPQTLRNNDTAIRNLLLRAPDGHAFPLKRVADIVAIDGQPQIERDNLRRMIAVTGRTSNLDLGSAIAEVKKVLSQPNMLDSGVTFELGGLYAQQQIAFKGLMVVFGSAVALVLALLLFMYEGFRIALSILTVPLIAAGSVFVGLWVTGIELNISAMMGMTMVIGIVTEVAIFYVSEVKMLIDEKGLDVQTALLEGGRNRLRPIAMTTTAAILALAPLALALGQGSAMQQPLAVAIISGLLVQLPLVLLALPVLLRFAMSNLRVKQ